MICLLAATPNETALLRQQLPLSPDPLLPGRSFSCQFCNFSILLVHTGIGAVSAAISLTRMLEHISPQLLIAFGCGGSYPASELQNGDLALATSELFGDLGTASDQGFIPLVELGLSPGPGEPELFTQQILLDQIWSNAALTCLQEAPELKGLKICQGPFVTVNMVSGTQELCRQLEFLSGGLCENMEGAALAQVASGYTIPFLEVRGISNPCGTRDRSQWDLKAGMTSAQRAVLRLLKDLPGLGGQVCS